MVTDPISDLLIRIKNGYAAKHDRVLIPLSKARFQIAKVLKDAGFVLDIDRKKKKIKNTVHNFLEIRLKYDNGAPAIEKVKIISRPSRRIYIKKDQIRPVLSGYGISIISTSKGIMTGKEAKKMNLGGQLIAEIW